MIASTELPEWVLTVNGLAVLVNVTAAAIGAVGLWRRYRRWVDRRWAATTTRKVNL